MAGVFNSLIEMPEHVREATQRFLDDSCIIAITDLRGDIVYANQAFARISGYARDELGGKNHRILKSGQHPHEFYRDMWKTVARGETWKGEICNRARDGRLYWVESTIAPLRDAGGHTTHYCALRIDITARKEAQQRLVDAMEQNAERRHLESVGRMADGILHDLNNLLGGAMMLADAGEGNDQTTAADQRAFLTRMAQLIRNVRDFSTGRAVEVRRCDAGRAIAEACRLASFVVRRERDVSINLDISEAEGCVFRINEAQLLEIVLNLFTNAVEALRDQPEPEINVTVVVNRDLGRLYLRIADNGPGVPASVSHRLFEPFVSSKGAGRGVGLAAARKLARALDGDLSLEPSTAGATFCLWLPAVIETPAAPHRPGHAPEARYGGLVLIADDDPEFLGMLEYGLRQYGIQTISATAADDAIIMAGRLRDCLTAVVLDSVGSVKEFALVGFLRSVRPDLPIVLVSGGLGRAGIQETQHGPVHVLPKPFAASDLVALLRPGTGGLPQR